MLQLILKQNNRIIEKNKIHYSLFNLNVTDLITDKNIDMSNKNSKIAITDFKLVKNNKELIDNFNQTDFNFRRNNNE